MTASAARAESFSGDEVRGGVVDEASLDDFPRIHAGLRQRAAKHFLGLEDPVLRIQEQDHENFIVPARQRHAQVVTHTRR